MSAGQQGPLRVGIVGLGFMGRTHLAAYARANAEGHANELAAVADRNPERRAGRFGSAGNIDTGSATFDPAKVRAFSSPDQLFADPSIDLVSLCTPTDSHVELAIAALEAGKHVLVEKPVALTSASVARLADAARAADTLCMPAMCVRFWPGWSCLRSRVERGDLGALRGLNFWRLGSRPDWSPGFYGDTQRSGGALFDLHVHDADMAHHICGPPRSVTAAGDRDHLTVLYHYEGGPRVAIEGGWDHDPAFDFRMGYRAVFERGSVEFDSRREQPLRIYHNGGEQVVTVEDATGYDLEISAWLAAVAAGVSPPPATVEQAVDVTRALEATAASLDAGGSNVPIAASRS